MSERSNGGRMDLRAAKRSQKEELWKIIKSDDPYSPAKLKDFCDTFEDRKQQLLGGGRGRTKDTNEGENTDDDIDNDDDEEEDQNNRNKGRQSLLAHQVSPFFDLYRLFTTHEIYPLLSRANCDACFHCRGTKKITATATIVAVAISVLPFP